MLSRHTKIGRALQEVAAERLKQVRQQLQDLEPAQVRLWLETGIKIERSARGMPDHLLAISRMTEDQLLDEYERLRGQLGFGDDAEVSGSQPGDEAARPSTPTPTDAS